MGSKKEAETELSDATLSPYLVSDYSSSDQYTEGEETSEDASSPDPVSHSDSIKLLRQLYNEANYGKHFGARVEADQRATDMYSPYIRRHKPVSLNVRKKRGSGKVGGRILNRSPVKRAVNKTSTTTVGSHNYIKENIESVKKGRKLKTVAEDTGKTRVVYDVDYEGCVYRVLPCHVKSTPNVNVLSINIEDGAWVEVGKNSVTRKLEYIGSIQAFKPPRSSNRENDIWVYKCKIAGRTYTIDPQDVKLCPKDGCTYLVHLKDSWHQLDPWGVCKLLRGQISSKTIVHKSPQHSPRPKQPYKCSFNKWL